MLSEDLRSTIGLLHKKASEKNLTDLTPVLIKGTGFYLIQAVDVFRKISGIHEKSGDGGRRKRSTRD